MEAKQGGDSKQEAKRVKLCVSPRLCACVCVCRGNGGSLRTRFDVAWLYLTCFVCFVCGCAASSPERSSFFWMESMPVERPSSPETLRKDLAAASTDTLLWLALTELLSRSPRPWDQRRLPSDQGWKSSSSPSTTTMWCPPGDTTAHPPTHTHTEHFVRARMYKVHRHVWCVGNVCVYTCKIQIQISG